MVTADAVDSPDCGLPLVVGAPESACPPWLSNNTDAQIDSIRLANSSLLQQATCVLWVAMAIAAIAASVFEELRLQSRRAGGVAAYNRGVALLENCRVIEAIAAWRESIRL